MVRTCDYNNYLMCLFLETRGRYETTEKVKQSGRKFHIIEASNKDNDEKRQGKYMVVTTLCLLFESRKINISVYSGNTVL